MLYLIQSDKNVPGMAKKNQIRKGLRQMKGLYLSSLLLIIAGATFTTGAQASNICRTGASNPPGGNTGVITLDTLRPYYDVEVGEVLGTGRIEANLTCYEASSTAFVLQLSPNSPEEMGSTICRTPLDGVGIRYRNDRGDPIPCTFWDQILHIGHPTVGSTHRLFVSQGVEFIRAKSITSLAAGLHDLKMPTSTTLNSFLPGLTNGAPWGNYTFTANTPLLVSTCVFAEASKTVDFQTVSMGTLSSSEQLFSIGLKSCGDRNAADFFNNIAKFKFTSTTMLANGTLGNSTCGTCAAGVAIEISDGNGLPVALNRDYNLRTGSFVISGDTIEHKFKAKLKSTGTVRPGRIDSVLTVIISSI